MDEDKKLATTFGGMLILRGDARSAFATFGYMLGTGELDLTGKLPSNQIEALKQAYADAFWRGRQFTIDS